MEENWHIREQHWDRYHRDLAGMGLGLPPAVEPGTRHGYKLNTIQIDPGTCTVTRDELLDAMTALGVGTGAHHPSIPEHSDYNHAIRWRIAGRQTVVLPLTPKVTDADMDRVISAVDDLLRSRPASS